MMQNQDIQGEQAKILYKQSLLLFIAIIILSGITLFYFWDRADRASLTAWAALVLLLTVARIKLVKTFNAKQVIENPSVWLKYFAFSSFLSGIIWGWVLLGIVSPVLANEVLLLSIILTGMSAGSVVSLSSYLPTYFAFTIPTLLPFGIYLFLQQDPTLVLTGTMVVIFLISMLGFSMMVNRNILDSIRLRFINVDLLEDLKIQKELAEKANIDKSRFLAATSHDLRQPLHALDLYLGALQVQLDDPKNTELVNKASASSQALSELLNALMDISKLDSGAIEVDKKYLLVKLIIESICNDFEQLAEKRNIVIKMQLDDVVINNDPILLSRMLRNLVANAIKHNKDCQIWVSTVTNNGIVKIIVRDNGQGIAVAELDNIFSEFYQLNNPERDRTKGLGLGLAIVDRLSTLLDITVDVESEVGTGSTFSLAMPTEDSSLIPIEDMHQGGSIDLAGLFLIVIDDEATVRDAIKSLLRAWGCEVLLASSEVESMSLIEQDSYPAPDLVISDYRLRDQKIGVDAVLAIREYFQLDIPAIIITGDSSKSIMAEIKNNNCQLLIKPVTSQVLRDNIETILSQAN